MASWLPDLTHDNISLQTIPFAWVIALAPRLWARRLSKVSRNKDMDTVHPREFAKSVADDTALDNRTLGRIVRAEGAMQNGLDNIGLFAAAVVAGNAAGLSPKLLNGLSVGYCLSRVAYNFVYIHAETRMQAHGRAATFLFGIACCFHLFVKAGEKFKHAVLRN